MQKVKVFLLTTPLLLCSRMALSQAVTATLVGTVTDTARASVATATVTITEQRTGAVATQNSNDSGNFQFTFLPPGVYTVKVVMQGFETKVTHDVPVTVNTTARIDVELSPGAVSQTVEVTDEAPLLKTDRSDVSTQFEEKQVEDLPLGSQRNFQALQTLVPGVSAPIYDHSAFFDSQNSQSFHVNGQSELANNLQVEGIDDNQRGGLLQVYIPPAAAIQTVDVETSNYAPEFGRSGGAVTNVVLKSGTNKIHGSAYEYNSISKTSARSYFNNTGIFPRFTNNYTGATIGAPIKKDRAFIFGDFLRYSNVQSIFNLFSVPTAAFRAGDFRGSPTAIYDPTTTVTDPLGNVTRKVFVSDASNLPQGIPIGTANVIPQTRLQTIPQGILAMIPLPNLPAAGNTNNYQEAVVLRQISDTFDIKYDQNVGKADHFTGRYSREVVTTVQNPAFGNAGGPVAGGYEGNGTDTTWIAAGEYTHVFTPKFFTEGRFGVSHFSNNQQPTDYGMNTATQLGIPGINTGLTSSGIPNVTINGFSAPIVGYASFIPETDPQTNIDVVNNWTKLFGNHSVIFGAELRAVRDDITQGQTYGTRGAYVYADKTTGVTNVSSGYANSMASFLLDLPNSAGIDVNVQDASFRQKMYFGFVQDTWQASPKLTLTYGLRYEVYAPPTARKAGGFSQYDDSTNSLQISGYGNIPGDLGVTKNLRNFQPRVGFAYRPDAGLVVRGGFGLSSSPFPDKFYAYNYPVKQNLSYNPVTTYLPAVYSNGTPVTFAGGFPAAPPPTYPANGIITNAPVSQVYTRISPTYKDPVIMSYNLSVEQSLGKGWTGTAAYVGNQGRQIPGSYNLNAGFVIGAGAAGQPEYAKFGRTAATNLLARGTSANYNSLQLQLQHHYKNGLTWGSAFAWQKALGFNSTGGGLAGYNFYIDPHRDYARLAWDTTNTYAQNFTYELPFGKNKMLLQHGVGSALLGGWQVSSLLTIQTGTPLFFSASSTALNAPGTTQVPIQVKPFTKLRGIGPNNLWFDPTAFITPPQVNGLPTQGNVGKNVYSGPGQIQFNASAFRSFRLTERFNLQFRMDALNALNHPTFANPSTDMTSSSFGRVTGVTGSAAAGNTGAPGRTLNFAGTVTF